jgi:hypothetical protein
VLSLELSLILEKPLLVAREPTLVLQVQAAAAQATTQLAFSFSQVL